jgi:hypothetical protein
MPPRVVEIAPTLPGCNDRVATRQAVLALEVPDTISERAHRLFVQTRSPILDVFFFELHFVFSLPLLIYKNFG